MAFIFAIKLAYFLASHWNCLISCFHSSQLAAKYNKPLQAALLPGLIQAQGH